MSVLKIDLIRSGRIDSKKLYVIYTEFYTDLRHICYTEFYTDLQYVFLHTSTQSPSMYILLFKVNSMYFNTEFGGTESIFFHLRLYCNLMNPG